MLSKNAIFWTVLPAIIVTLASSVMPNQNMNPLNPLFTFLILCGVCFGLRFVITAFRPEPKE